MVSVGREVTSFCGRPVYWNRRKRRCPLNICLPSQKRNVMPEFLFSVAGAARLASLAGIKADLDRVLEYCERMIERYAGSHLKTSPFDIVGFTMHVDFIDSEPLSTAACVAYARCFVSGVRQSLDATLLQGAESELRGTHELIMNLRNKHVAYSVNSFEENSVTRARRRLEDFFQSSAEICGAVPRHTRQASLFLEVPSRLKQLTSWRMSQVQVETAAETERVLGLARAVPLEEVRALGQLKQSSSEDRQLHISRRRGQP